MTAQVLPTPRGPLSEAVVDALRGEPGPVGLPRVDADPYGEDLQLALLACYELHYLGFADVDAAWEWDPDLLRARAVLEGRLHEALRDDVSVADDAVGALDELTVESGERGVSHFLADDGQWSHFCDYFTVRSIYQLKEADPHAWAIPRLRGSPKAALVAVEFDEFGAGHGRNVHQDMFARLLHAADLRDDYLGYLDEAPAAAMFSSNLMSLLGLHRAHRGAIVGHLAATEITSSPGSRRVLAGLERLDAPPACQVFYREHVEADAVHEQVMRLDVVGELVKQEPELDADVAFGVACFSFVEDLIGEHLMSEWAI